MELGSWIVCIAESASQQSVILRNPAITRAARTTPSARFAEHRLQMGKSVPFGGGWAGGVGKCWVVKRFTSGRELRLKLTRLAVSLVVLLVGRAIIGGQLMG